MVKSNKSNNSLSESMNQNEKALLNEKNSIQNGINVRPTNHQQHDGNSNNDTSSPLKFESTGGMMIGTLEPPDGGPRAWIIMVASFFCNGLLFGIINSYSLFYDKFHDNLLTQNVTNPASKAALIGSLAMGTTFFISPLSGLLTDLIGLGQTTFLGGAIASSGMFLSSFCVDNYIALSITFGIMYGLGGALAYTPSLAILGHYFKKYLGIVNGIVTAGSSIFTICMPYVIDGLFKKFGVVWTLRILSFMACLIMIFAFLFKPPSVVNGNNKSNHKKISIKDAFNMNVLNNKKYVIWTLTIAFSLFGYFVPYVYMLNFVKSNFKNDVDGKLPVLCIGITSGLGRLIFGYIADMPNVNRIFLQQIAFFNIGILTMLLPITIGSFPFLLIITLGMGLFDGCFISLLGPIAFDICGCDGATQAIGFLLGMCSIPLTIGPFLAGEIYEKQHTYTLPLLLAGIPPTIGSLLMFSIRFVKTSDTNRKKLQNNIQGKIKTTEPLRGDNIEDDGPV